MACSNVVPNVVSLGVVAARFPLSPTRQVGDALRASGKTRDQYFVTSMTSPCQCLQDSPHCERNITDLANCSATTKAEVRARAPCVCV
jgi:hypothetical protein